MKPALAPAAGAAFDFDGNLAMLATLLIPLIALGRGELQGDAPSSR